MGQHVLGSAVEERRKALDPKLFQRVFACATDGTNAPLMVVALATAASARKMQRLNKDTINILKNDVTNIFATSTDEEKMKDASMLEALLPLQV